MKMVVISKFELTGWVTATVKVRVTPFVDSWETMVAKAIMQLITVHHLSWISGLKFLFLDFGEVTLI